MARSILSKITLRHLVFFPTLALLFSFAFTGPVRGSIIPPAGSLSPFPPDIFAACAGCTQLAYTTSGTVLSTNGKLNFILNAAVYRDPGNIFGANDLDFVYQVINVGGGTAIDSIN